MDKLQRPVPVTATRWQSCCRPRGEKPQTCDTAKKKKNLLDIKLAVWCLYMFSRDDVIALVDPCYKIEVIRKRVCVCVGGLKNIKRKSFLNVSEQTTEPDRTCDA